MDYPTLKGLRQLGLQNMGNADRVIRSIIGVLLVYLGLITQTLTDSYLINTLCGLFGLTNVIASTVGICPAYLLVKFSTRNKKSAASPQNNRLPANDKNGLPSVSQPRFLQPVLLKDEQINRNLVLSITLPVAFVLMVFTYLFFELSTSNRKNSDVDAANAIAEMALHIEATGEGSFARSRTEGVVAIIFHNAHGNIVPTILEKIPENTELREELLEHLAPDHNHGHDDDHGHFDVADQTLYETTRSIPNKDLYVTVFYRSSAPQSFVESPLFSRLIFTALFALWMCAWTTHYIIKRYTDYVKKSSDALKYRSTHDLLTGLPNRTGFEEALFCRTSNLNGSEPFSVIAIDISNFRYFNGTLGHQTGDRLLIEIAERLKDSVSAVDTVARLNGDEFCVLSSIGENQHDTAFSMAESIRESLCKPMNLDSIRIDVECNIGIASYPEHSNDGNDLIRLSNIALHNTKKQSAHITEYDTRKDKHNGKSLAIITELQSAIESDQLHLEYQPKIDVSTGVLQGVEALIRWYHPIYKNVPPIEFIGWAEKSGLIDQLTFWVLAQAEAQCIEWKQAGLSIPIAINLSPVNLENEDILKSIKRSVTQGGFTGGLLEIELTENAVVKDADKALEQMRELQSYGVKISIDDFGTGLASFSYLRNFPANNLKIDRAFVNLENPDEHDLKLLQSMIDLGHNLNCVVTAEGVENEETLSLLRSYHCDFAQGYHICRPTLPKNVEAWIASNDISLLKNVA